MSSIARTTKNNKNINKKIRKSIKKGKNLAKFVGAPAYG